MIRTLWCWRKFSHANMSAPMKRSHGIDDEHEKDAKVEKKSLSNDKSNLCKFLEWSTCNSFKLSQKVRIGKEGSCAQYGMIAVEDIAEGEELFQIPRAILLSPETSAISHILRNGADDILSKSGWVPVLLALMHEYHKRTSQWRPYLDLVPDFNQLDLPFFWTRAELERELEGTGVIKAADRDLTSLTDEFEAVVLPFVKKHKEYFRPECEDLEFYKKMVAFVMAYSFTEPSDSADISDEDKPSAPMMVPMADILNHVAKNNAHLKFDKDALKMVSTKPIRQGEEVYNTYGQLPNWQLLQMYGFAEKPPNNHYDTVDIPVQVVMGAAQSLKANQTALMEHKITFLQLLGITEDSESFIIGVDGVITEEEMYETLKVLVMGDEDFEAYKEKEDWSDADTDSEQDESLTWEAMKTLPESWKAILKSSAEVCLQNYVLSSTGDSLDPDTLSSRQKFSLFTRDGQRKILKHIIDSCS